MIYIFFLIFILKSIECFQGTRSRSTAPETSTNSSWAWRRSTARYDTMQKVAIFQLFYVHLLLCFSLTKIENISIENSDKLSVLLLSLINFNIIQFTIRCNVWRLVAYNITPLCYYLSPNLLKFLIKFNPVEHFNLRLIFFFPQECKNAFDSLSKLIQRIIASRRELAKYENRTMGQKRPSEEASEVLIFIFLWGISTCRKCIRPR